MLFMYGNIALLENRRFETVPLSFFWKSVILESLETIKITPVCKKDVLQISFNFCKISVF